MCGLCEFPRKQIQLLPNLPDSHIVWMRIKNKPKNPKTKVNTVVFRLENSGVPIVLTQ